jgi:DNA-binding IclR family transcriptional regulator
MKELEIMQNAGLTVYQSKVYCVLKSANGLRPAEIIDKSGVPSSKVHETLHSLENLGLVKRQLDKRGAAEIDRKITEFIAAMRGNKVGVKVYGRGRVRLVWSTNGVSLASLVDRKIERLQKVKQAVARYEKFENS